MSNVIVTCNTGSHNTKLAVFDAATLRCLGELQTHSEMETLAWLCATGERNIVAIAHRVVHGGKQFVQHAHINDEVIRQLHSLDPLAPLHQPQALKLIRETRKLYPDVLQIACFDTGFFHDVPDIEKRLPLPRRFHSKGLQRYGFHGLSYQYIAHSLAMHVGEKAKSRVIVAHLGGGSSICAMHHGKPVASTMGFSTLDGLMMGTRPGTMDPGVLLYLMEEYRMKPSELADMLYNECGLKGVSGQSANMETLLTSKKPHAKEAIELYCHLAARQLAGLIPALGGLDVLVFTGGIGQHAPQIRQRICDQLSWLGICIDSNTDDALHGLISDSTSDVTVYVIPTNEARVMAEECQYYLGQKVA